MTSEQTRLLGWVLADAQAQMDNLWNQDDEIWMRNTESNTARDWVNWKISEIQDESKYYEERLEEGDFSIWSEDELTAEIANRKKLIDELEELKSVL